MNLLITNFLLFSPKLWFCTSFSSENYCLVLEEVVISAMKVLTFSCLSGAPWVGLLLSGGLKTFQKGDEWQSCLLPAVWQFLRQKFPLGVILQPCHGVLLTICVLGACLFVPCYPTLFIQFFPKLTWKVLTIVTAFTCIVQIFCCYSASSAENVETFHEFLANLNALIEFLVFIWRW